MRGKLPVTEKLILESGEAEWSLVANGLIRELRTSAIIEISLDKKVRVNLVLKNIFSPEQVKVQMICRSTSNLGLEESQGFNRITIFINDMIEKNKWVFFGYIDGENQAPIMITYYSALGIFVYTQKINTETEKDFLKISQLN